MKNGQPSARSSSSSRVARITAGNANTIIPGEDQHRPGKHRQLVEGHARRAGAENADDDLDRAGDRRNLDEADAEQPEISPTPGENCVLVSGGYMNQPPFGARSKNSVQKNTSRRRSRPRTRRRRAAETAGRARRASAAAITAARSCGSGCAWRFLWVGLRTSSHEPLECDGDSPVTKVGLQRTGS